MAATRRSSASGLQALIAVWPIPECGDSVSFSPYGCHSPQPRRNTDWPSRASISIPSTSTKKSRLSCGVGLSSSAWWMWARSWITWLHRCSYGRQPPRVLHRHRAHVLLTEAGGQEALGHRGEAVLHRRVVALAEVGGEHRVLRAASACVGDQDVPLDLPGVRRGEAALEQRPLAGQRALVLRGERLRGELGMGDDDVLDALLAGGVDDREDLVAAQMAGGQQHPV